MNGVKLLWKKRIQYLVKTYYRFVAFQFDWIIIFYTMLFLFLISYNYFPLMLQIKKQIYMEPWRSLILFTTTAMITGGSYRGYLRIADEVFLLPFYHLRKTFVTYSSYLSIVLQIGLWSLYLGLVALIAGNLGRKIFGPLQSIWLMGMMIKLINMNIKYVLFHLPKRWIIRPLKIMSQLTVWALTYYLLVNYRLASDIKLIITLIMLLLLTLIIKLKIRPQWIRWITEEVSSRSKSMALLLQEGIGERRSYLKKTLPAFNGRLLEPFNQKGGMLLLYYRILLRGSGNLKIILSILGVLIGLTIFIKEPKAIGALILFGIFLMGNFLFSIWHALKDDQFLRLFPIPLKDRNVAFKQGPLLVLILITVILFITMQAIQTVILWPPLDLLIFLGWAWIICEIKTFTLNLKKV
ncbi:ABC transporter permease [Alkaliphilus crotonatoxidans]